MRIAGSRSRRFLYAGLIIGLLLTTGSLLAARGEQRTTTKPVCADDNGGITLPAGFCATVFADNVGHASHLVVAPNGVVYVNSGSATNACQVQNRMPNSPGYRPCTELETRAGIWRYEAERTGQRFSPAERFVTGLRNSGGVAVDSTGVGIYATQHGRDQLAENWSALYTPEQGANLPAEELVRIEGGADYGWPA